MPRIFEQDGNGRFQTDGLDLRDFSRVFNEIARKNNEKRRRAKRTLTPGILSRGKRNSIADIVRLGRKSDGTEFTLEELKRFDDARKKFKKRAGGQQGITYLELVARSAESRIERASNRSNDRRGVSRGQLASLRTNIAEIRVKASQRSVHQDHRVTVRFEQWDELMADASGKSKGYVKAVKKACAGRVSFNCSCGDHQYRYRYMATLGNYALAPPKEWAFPKIRNPTLKGLACKHVLLSMRMMQSPVWQKRLAVEMEKQANSAGYGDDRRRKVVFEGDDEKALGKNRTTSIDTEKTRQAWDKYQARRKVVGETLKRNQAEIDKLRDKATKARKTASKAKQEAERLRQENEALKKQAAELMRDRIKLQYQSFADAFKMAGLPADKAMSAFADKNKIPLATLKEIVQ